MSDTQPDRPECLDDGTDIDLDNPLNLDHVLNQGRVGWWLALPGLDAGPRASDLTGMFPATLVGMGNSSNGWRPTSRPGGFGHLLYDGSGGYLDCGNGQAFGTNLRVMAASFNATTIGGDQWLVARDDNSLGRAFAFGLQSGQLSFQFNGGGLISGAGPTVAAGSWHRAMAINIPSYGWKLYLDGAPAGSSPDLSSINVTTGSTTIGRRTYSGFNGSFPGAIDDAAIWGANPLALASPDAFAALDYEASCRGYPGVLNRT